MIKLLCVIFLIMTVVSLIGLCITNTKQRSGEAVFGWALSLLYSTGLMVYCFCSVLGV